MLYNGFLIAFFEAAGKTWQCFTSEFAPGGLIDETTAEEKEVAWMPPTNDANEGALGGDAQSPLSVTRVSHG